MLFGFLFEKCKRVLLITGLAIGYVLPLFIVVVIALAFGSSSHSEPIIQPLKVSFGLFKTISYHFSQIVLDLKWFTELPFKSQIFKIVENIHTYIGIHLFIAAALTHKHWLKKKHLLAILLLAIPLFKLITIKGPEAYSRHFIVTATFISYYLITSEVISKRFKPFFQASILIFFTYNCISLFSLGQKSRDNGAAIHWTIVLQSAVTDYLQREYHFDQEALRERTIILHSSSNYLTLDLFLPQSDPDSSSDYFYAIIPGEKYLTDGKFEEMPDLKNLIDSKALSFHDLKIIKGVAVVVFKINRNSNELFSPQTLSNIGWHHFSSDIRKKFEEGQLKNTFPIASTCVGKSSYDCSIYQSIIKKDDHHLLIIFGEPIEISSSWLYWRKGFYIDDLSVVYKCDNSQEVSLSLVKQVRREYSGKPNSGNSQFTPGLLGPFKFEIKTHLCPGMRYKILMNKISDESIGQQDPIHIYQQDWININKIE